MNLARRSLLAVFACILAVSCGRTERAVEPQAPAPEVERSVRVFAAASLSDVMEALSLAWMSRGGAGPVVNLAGSSTLARQIEDGAEADVFISADEAWMDYLAERKLIDPASRADLLGNTLVLVTPAGRPFDIKLEKGADLAAALGEGRLALANPESVPAGRYAREALVALGMWEAVEGKVAAAQDVRAALRFVTSGEAEAGVVYATDAKAAGDSVHVAAAFPAELHAAIVYPAALTPAGASAPEARAFLDFLSGAEARAIFEAHGFTVLPAR